VVVLLFVVYQLFGTNITEEHNQAALAKQFQAAIAPETAAPAPAKAAPPANAAPAGCVQEGQAKSTPLATPTEGQVIDHLVIPKLGESKYVVEGTQEGDLDHGPGHYTGTPYPGQVGNVGIAGHRTTYGAPFFELNRMTTGDLICLTDLNNRTWVYKVSGPPMVVSPDDVAVLNPTTFAQLTLTTCNPRFEATNRLVVFARLVGRALPPTVAPKKAPTVKTIAGVDNLTSGNKSAWPSTIMYGAFVIVLWIGTRLWINRSRRWHRAAAYIVGIGVCLLPLWFMFENVVRLLPQSI
jgi:sortase A